MEVSVAVRASAPHAPACELVLVIVCNRVHYNLPLFVHTYLIHSHLYHHHLYSTPIAGLFRAYPLWNLQDEHFNSKEIHPTQRLLPPSIPLRCASNHPLSRLSSCRMDESQSYHLNTGAFYPSYPNHAQVTKRIRFIREIIRNV